MMLTRTERDAMGDDEYHPISRKGTNLTEAGGIGYTVVDSIDTMLIMGLSDEYARARNWVANEMTFDRDANFNTFEVCASYLDIVTLKLDRWRRLQFVFSVVFFLRTTCPDEIPSILKRQRSLPTAFFQRSTHLQDYL